MENAFPFLSRVVNLTPAQARAAFDALADDRGRQVVTAAGALDVDRPELVPPRLGYWPYRQAQGRLQARKASHGLDVHLELLPWSTGSVELGLSVLTPPRRRQRRLSRDYVDVGPRLLEEMAELMEQSQGGGTAREGLRRTA